MNRRHRLVGSFLLMAALLGTACDTLEAPIAPVTAVSPTAPAVTNDTDAPSLSPEPTAVPPTSTPSEPMAALVNGRPIFVAAYERELTRFEQAQVELGTTPGTDYQTMVLDTLIERELIAQAAAGQGIAITPEAVTAKLTDLEGAAGESGNFAAWLEANQWTRAEFQDALAAEMLTEEMVAAVTANVPTAVEQVNARYLQVDDLALAESLLQQIRSGADFAALAREHSLDRITGENGGDLDYFARGSLLVTAVEEVAFSLEPGGVSEIVTVVNESGLPTYYLVQLIERDPQRPLSADMRYTMLRQTFESWLDGLWQQADITRLIESGT